MDGAQPSKRPGDATYPDLCERHSRARLVVLAAEVRVKVVGRGGRLSQATYQSQGERCASCSASQGETGVADVLELLAGLQQRSCFRAVALTGAQLLALMETRPCFLTWWVTSATCL